MSKHKQEKKGEIFAFGTLLFHSLFPVLLVYGVKHIPPFQFMAIVTVVGFFIFFSSQIFFKKIHELFIKKHWPQLLLYSVLISSPYIVIFFMSQFTSSINVTLLMQSEVLFAGLIGYFFLKEKIESKRLLGMTLVLGSNLVILSAGTSGLGAADWLIFLVPLLFVIANTLTKDLMTKIHWSTILTVRSVITFFMLLPLVIFFEDPVVFKEGDLLFLLFFGVFVFGLAKIFWQIAIKRMDISKATGMIMTYPAISLLWAYFILDELPQGTQWIGVVLMLFGFFFLIQSRSKQYEEPM
jgi:drug/metabolite transporter (DMT)-like permease